MNELPMDDLQRNAPRILEVRRKIFKENDLLARRLRERFRAAGVRVVSLVSSPGAGKTALLERLMTELRPRYRMAALVGDLSPTELVLVVTLDVVDKYPDRYKENNLLYFVSPKNLKLEVPKIKTKET